MLLAIAIWMELNLTFWIKSRSDAALGRSPRERREEGAGTDGGDISIAEWNTCTN